MRPRLFIESALIPALSLLPPKLDTPEARAQVLAICLQETKLQTRKQNYGGPARSYAQFEVPGVHALLKHALTRPLVRAVLQALDYDATDDAVYLHRVLEHNDVLCAAMSRINLYWLPAALPKQTQVDEGWEQYLLAWNPGKPRKENWPGNFRAAWQFITHGEDL